MGTDSTSTCDALRELVGALALGEDAWLSDDERRRAEAHVADCAACRAYMADLAAIAGALRSLGEADVEVPERVLLENRYRILAAVRAKTLELRRRRLESAWRRRARLGWSACAAAAVLVVALGLWAWRLWRTPADAVLPVVRAPVASSVEPAPHVPGSRADVQPPVVAHAEPEAPAVTDDDGGRAAAPPLVTRLAPTADVGAELTALRRAYDEAKAAPTDAQDVFGQIVARVEALLAAPAAIDHRIEALRLVYDCQLQLADRKAAHEAFVAYADALGERAAQQGRDRGLDAADVRARADEYTAGALIAEAVRLFEIADPLLAQSYCDILVTRYPNCEYGWRGRVLTGLHCIRTRQPNQGANMLLAVVRDAPQSLAARRARMSLPSALYNAGRRDEAVQMCIEYAEACESREERAAGYLKAGVLLALQGRRQFPRAVRVLRKVVGDFADTGVAKEAETRLLAIEREIEQDILDM